MFLHSGASLHGHEYTNPQRSFHLQQRKTPFLRSALPAPILRSTSSSASSRDRRSYPSPSSRPAAGKRTVSDVDVRPISDLFDKTQRVSSPPAPVVRFKDPDVVEEFPTSPSMPDDDTSSLYDSDASTSQATCSTPRRRRRRKKAVPRESTVYLLASPPPRPASKTNLFKTARPKLLLQLQELAANQRPRPTIDAFPATARYINRFPRLFGVKGEPGPRDLVLVRSEDYTAEDDGETHDSCTGRRQPIAVLSLGRGQGDSGEIVLENGKVWTWSCQKNNYSFVHVDEGGNAVTVRWVKRNPAKKVAGAPSITPSAGGDSAEPDYTYTFSSINPLVRRHPILATLSPQSLEIYDDYTTPSSSSGRYPPTRPVGSVHDVSKDPPSSPSSPFEELSTRRETHSVDQETKTLIRVTGLWLALRLRPALDCSEANDSAPSTHEASVSSPSSLGSVAMPRRQTTSNVSCGSPSLQPNGLRRAMSISTAFMQRKRRQESSLDAPSGTTAELGRVTIAEEDRTSQERPSGGSQTLPTQKQARRVNWFKRVTL